MSVKLMINQRGDFDISIDYCNRFRSKIETLDFENVRQINVKNVPDEIHNDVARYIYVYQEFSNMKTRVQNITNELTDAERAYKGSV